MDTLPPPRKFIYSLVIREQHLDTFGHVNNATYLQLLEEARWEFITSRGFGLSTIQKTGLGPTVLECHIKFLKELRLREQVTIESEILSYEKKIGMLRQNILDTENKLCCTTEMVIGLFDLKARKLVLPTPEWLYACGITDTI